MCPPTVMLSVKHSASRMTSYVEMPLERYTLKHVFMYDTHVYIKEQISTEIG
jgi:hypothetical protein